MSERNIPRCIHLNFTTDAYLHPVGSSAQLTCNVKPRRWAKQRGPASSKIEVSSRGCAVAPSIAKFQMREKRFVAPPSRDSRKRGKRTAYRCTHLTDRKRCHRVSVSQPWCRGLYVSSRRGVIFFINSWELCVSNTYCFADGARINMSPSYYYVSGCQHAHVGRTS